MLAPRLRHRVDFKALTTTKDLDGAIDEVWAMAFPSVPAEVVPLSGHELFAAAAAQSSVTARITVRAGLAIDPAMRIEHGANIYNIVSISDDPTFARHVTIMAEKGLRNG